MLLLRFNRIATAVLFCAIIISAQVPDTLNYQTEEVSVFGKKLYAGESLIKFQSDRYTDLLSQAGIYTMTKGIFFAQDIYMGGFKRSDVQVTIEGERYHNACPMRMDAPISRVNPLEIASVEVNPSGDDCCTGLGGNIDFARTDTKDSLFIRANLLGTTGALQVGDAAVTADYSNVQVKARYAYGLPYENAEGKSFKDLYGYKTNQEYYFYETGARAEIGDWETGITYTYTDKLSFPYLQMDEINSTVYSGFVSYKTHKFYTNFTEHLMDNSLRKNPMFMRTFAKSLTLGLVGDNYELFYRYRDATNYLKPPTMATIYNNMMPKVMNGSASVKHSLDVMGVQLNLRAGVVGYALEENAISAFYKKYGFTTETDRYFPIGSISVVKGFDMGAYSIGLLAEVQTEAPEPENLYINVARPMGKPDQSGNPDLLQPLKTGARFAFTYDALSVEAFGYVVGNNITLQRKTVGTKGLLTYTNTNALLLGAQATYTTKYSRSMVIYNFGQQYEKGKPLSEIMPLTMENQVFYSPITNGTVFVKHTFNLEQTRVDASVLELATPTWNRIDLGARYSWGGLTGALEVQNVLDHNYYQHLSYLRDPFSSGFRVFEPGRSVRLTITMN